MKTYIPYSILAAIAACGLASAQTAYTTPVGYVTKALPANQFTLVGLTVHNPTVAAGIIDTESANSVTDTQSNFTTLLATGSTYILEFEDGTVQEIVSWSGGVLTTPDDISTLVTPGVSKFKLRRAATVADVFGANNSAGLSPDSNGSFAGTDLVLILNSVGAFDTVYYFNDGAGTAGWFTESGDPAANKVIAYPDSFFVKRSAGSPLNLLVSGEVKIEETSGRLVSGFNYVNSVGPAGVTLASSGLEAFLNPDTNGSFTGSDFVLIQQPNGAYLTTYYFNDGAGTTGWFTEAGDPAGTTSLDGGFLLKSASGPKPFTVNIPASYTSP